MPQDHGARAARIGASPDPAFRVSPRRSSSGSTQSTKAAADFEYFSIGVHGKPEIDDLASRLTVQAKTYQAACLPASRRARGRSTGIRASPDRDQGQPGHDRGTAPMTATPRRS
jgi:hypothetical protein